MVRKASVCRRSVVVGSAAAAAAAAVAPFTNRVAAHTSQVPITIVINQSPWFNGFRGAVDAYEKATGNKVTLDVNPFAGSLEKQRNSVRAREGQYDLLTMNGLFFVE